jgi:hypothetical protein
VPAVAGGDPITIDLVAMPAITGRVTGSVVDPHSGNRSASGPDPGIHVRYVLSPPPPIPPITGSAPVRNGQFLIHHDASTPIRCNLEIWSDSPSRLLVTKAIDTPFVGSKDVGEIALPGPPPTVLFHVTNTTGEPIAKARILAAGLASAPSDGEGRTAIGVPPGTRTVIAGAPGYRIIERTLPDPLPQTLDVRLEPAAMLVVRVRHEDPAVPLDGLRVAVRYDVDEITGAADSSYDFGEVRMARPGSATRMSSGGKGIGGGEAATTPQPEAPSFSGQQTNRYDVEPGKDLSVSGFKKGDQIQVMVEDQYEHKLLDETIRVAEDDVTPIELVVRSKPRHVRGTVLDQHGRPVPSARVRMGVWREFTATTDEAGRFDLAAAFGDEATLSISAAGQLPKIVDARLTEEPIEIRLERARPLIVELTGPVPAAWDGSVTFETEDGTTYGASPRGERFHAFEAIPLRAGVVKVKSGGRATSVPIGAEEVRTRAARP